MAAATYGSARSSRIQLYKIRLVLCMWGGTLRDLINSSVTVHPTFGPVDQTWTVLLKTSCYMPGSRVLWNIKRSLVK
jgi:hypothetical protein